MTEDNRRVTDLFNLIESLNLEGVDSKELTDAIAGHEYFAQASDVVLAIAQQNRPTDLIVASNRVINREQARLVIEAAREDRANELIIPQAPIVGTSDRPLVIARSLKEMTENELIELLGREGKNGSQTLAILLELEQRPLVADHTIFVPTKGDATQLDVQSSNAALASYIQTHIEPRHWGVEQVATLSLHQFVWGGTPADPITGEALQAGISPSSKAHWSSLSREHLLWVAFARLSNRQLPPARTVVDELSVPDEDLDMFWKSVRADVEKARIFEPGRVAAAEGVLLYEGGARRNGDTSFR